MFSIVKILPTGEIFSTFKRKFQGYVPLNSVVPNTVVFIVVTEMVLSSVCYIFPFFLKKFRFRPKKRLALRHPTQSFSI